MNESELTCCQDCEHYFQSDIYDGEYYCEAKKDWFGGKFEIIEKFAINECAEYKD